jgi:hypothetical protein
MTTRLRALSEAEAYARCYQSASDDVRVVKIPRRPRYQLEVSGEDLRVAFAEKLDGREPEVDGDHLDPSIDGPPDPSLEAPVAEGEAVESPAAEEAA